MAISSTTNRVSYAGNGSTTVFSFPYKFLANADLIVIEVNNTTGAETTKTITTHYTVVGAGVVSGGTVTMITAPASGVTLVIVRSPSLTQTLDLVENDSLPAESLEEALDRSTMIHQRTRELVDRAVTLPDGFTDTFDTSLPALMADNPGASVIINSTGDGFEIGATGDEISSAQTYAQAASDSADAAAASESAAGVSETNAAASAASAAVGTFTGALLLPHISTPSTPAAGYDKLYFKNDNKVYFLNPAGSESLVVNNAEVISKVLTGYSSGSGTVEATDSILQAIQKLNGNAAYGARFPYVAKTTTYTALTTDYFINVDGSGGAWTLTLPAASGNTGLTYVIKRTDNTLANAVTVDGNASETIDGATTTTLNTQYEELTIYCDGSNWKIITRYIPSVWTAFTPTGSWTANVTYTGFWRRVGDSIDLQYLIDLTGTPTSATLTFNPPTNITFDYGKMISGVGNTLRKKGTSEMRSAGSFYMGVTNTLAGDLIAPRSFNPSGSFVTTLAVTATSPATFTSSDMISVIIYNIPVTGWNG